MQIVSQARSRLSFSLVHVRRRVQASACILMVVAAVPARPVAAAQRGMRPWAVQYGPFITVAEGRAFATRLTASPGLHAVVMVLHGAGWRSQVLVEGYVSASEAQVACSGHATACFVRRNPFPQSRQKVVTWIQPE